MAMARATVGVCIGACVAISATFVASQLLPWLAAEARIASMERWICLLSWAACAAWACLRRPIRAALDLLVLASLVTALVPIAHGLSTGRWFWLSLASGQTATASVDLGALTMAVAFAWLARITARRSRRGEPNSVWAGETASR